MRQEIGPRAKSLGDVQSGTRTDATASFSFPADTCFLCPRTVTVSDKFTGSEIRGDLGEKSRPTREVKVIDTAVDAAKFGAVGPERDAQAAQNDHVV